MVRDLNSWLEYIQTKHCSSTKLGIAHLRPLVTRLGLTSLPGKVITVAGTNGKGSCIATMQACLLAQGFLVGSYTSPHLFNFTERLQINGISVAAEVWCAEFAKLEAIVDIEVASYFEFITLAAFKIMQAAKLDYYLLEIGLGGRLDVVNIMPKDIAIITSISLDHCHILGNTRAKIAKEKAGIIEADKPIICGDIKPPAVIANIAGDKGAKLYQIGKDFNCSTTLQAWQFQFQEKIYSELPLVNFPLSNAACALSALELLNINWQVKALTQINILGRWQGVKSWRQFWFDVAHNPAGTKELAVRIKKLIADGHKVHAIVGIGVTKELTGVLRPLLNYISSWFPISLTTVAAYGADVIKKLIQTKTKAPVYACNEVGTALDLIETKTDKADHIVVFGSFHTVAAIMPMLHL